MEELKKKIGEFCTLAKECPETLQSICFEVLLKDYLDRIQIKGKPKYDEKDKPEPHKKQPLNVDEEEKEPIKAQDDIQVSDLHVKAKRFLDKYSLTINNLNEVLYKEGDDFLPLFDDLGSTKASECQIRLTLLDALVSAIKTGDFKADVKIVRQKCQDYKCYDPNNFGRNYTNNKDLFDFEKYDKNAKFINLSESGKQSLSQLIQKLK